jgi:DNA-binding transcriptional ArsR family regulator
MVVDNLSSAFAALSDPTRRTILHRLARGPATVNELAKPFEISQQAISKHVAYLERARLIEKRRRGREHLCALRPNAIKRVAEWADGYRRFWSESFERLDTLLAEMKEKESRRGRRQ